MTLATAPTWAALDEVRWIGVSDADALCRAACRRIEYTARQAIALRGRYFIVLAGGVIPTAVYRLLREADCAWSRWQVFFSDERCLPTNDHARNSHAAATAWLDHVAIPPTQIHVIPAERGAHTAAAAYAHTLHGVGLFDLVLLGLGADGHIAGLFPGREWGVASDTADTIAIHNAPVPPAERVAQSASRLCRSRAALVLVSGENKRRAVTRWRSGERLPVNAIKLASGVDVLIEKALLEPHSIT